MRRPWTYSYGHGPDCPKATWAAVLAQLGASKSERLEIDYGVKHPRWMIDGHPCTTGLRVIEAMVRAKLLQIVEQVGSKLILERTPRSDRRPSRAKPTQVGSDPAGEGA